MTANPPVHWQSWLGRSERGGRDYEPKVEGKVPVSLQGSLYRNGPGLFERNGYRKRHLLDGDGLVQRLSFCAGRVRYQNEFVRTPKFEAEAAAGRYLQATWTTRRPGGFARNLGGAIAGSQAGVTINPVHGKLLARDETGPSFEIDGETLATLGAVPIDEGRRSVAYKAHSKLDPRTGAWLLAGQRFGPKMTIHTAIYESGFRCATVSSFESPRQVYVHDFLVTEHYYVFVLHPCYFSPSPFLAGLSSFVGSLRWKPAAGNLIAVLARGDDAPRFYEGASAFMWHSLNAFEVGDEIVADFVGFDTPDHFIGDDALLSNIMRDRAGRASVPGKLRRYRIDLRGGGSREETLDHGNHEFPMLDARTVTMPHRFGYFACGGVDSLNTGLKRFDCRTGASDVYDFGDRVQVGEPVFVPGSPARTDQGWLISECLDGTTATTFFALLDAVNLAGGPVAIIRLPHHVPLSFHGSWVSTDPAV